MLKGCCISCGRTHVPVLQSRYTTVEVYLEPIRTSTMERFCKNSYRLLAVNYFRKEAPM